MTMEPELLVVEQELVFLLALELEQDMDMDTSGIRATLFVVV